MKISIKTALTILFIAINTACSEDTEYRIDEGLNTETFETITPMTMQMNSQATGAVISDEIYDYYRYLDGNSLMLYKKNRKSGRQQHWLHTLGAKNRQEKYCYQTFI